MSDRTDQKFLQMYTEELDFLRRMSGEFARDFPTVASRLDLTQFDCKDPWVERLLEGVAYLTSRVRRELDGGMPLLAESLVSISEPRATSPLPSMAVLQLNYSGDLKSAKFIPPETIFNSEVAADSRTGCTWRTLRPATLRPASVLDASLNGQGAPEAGISLKGEEGSWMSLGIDVKVSRKIIGDGTPLTFQLQGPPEFPGQILKCLRSHCTRIAVCDEEKVLQWLSPSQIIDSVDLEMDERSSASLDEQGASLLLMQRYASLPQQFHTMSLKGIDGALMPANPGAIRFVFLLDNEHEELGSRIRSEMFVLNSVPVVNLFHRRADRIIIDKKQESHQVIADRTRPMDYEIYDIDDVDAIDSDGKVMMSLRSVYDIRDLDSLNTGFYSIRRTPRRDSEHSARYGGRSKYRGTNSSISLTVPPKSTEPIDQLSLGVWCTNRDLPLLLSRKAKCLPAHESSGLSFGEIILGPSDPRMPEQDVRRQWNMLGQMAHGFMRVVDQSGVHQDSASLQSVLSTYIDPDDKAGKQQVSAITRISAEAVVRRRMVGRRAAELRGLKCSIQVSEKAIRGGVDVYTLPLVISRFLRRYIPVSSFLEACVTDEEGKELYSWMPMDGRDSMI